MTRMGLLATAAAVILALGVACDPDAAPSLGIALRRGKRRLFALVRLEFQGISWRALR